MKDCPIRSVSEFIAHVSEINKTTIAHERETNMLLFRGQSNSENILLPSIGRHTEEVIGEPFLREERNMVEMAKFKLPEVFNNTMQPIDLLALLQHHGIPTRLLDISENALVALYFACASEKDSDKDGEVLVFSHHDQTIENYPMINAIADSYRFVRGDKTSLELFFEQVIKQPYFLEQTYLYENDITTPEDGARWVRDCCKEIMIIYAKSYGLRQRIQRGRYVLFPNDIVTGDDGKDYFVQSVTPIPKDHKAIVARFIVPGDCKQEIMEDLRLLGISRDMLFLDNVDIICREISDRVKEGRN